MKIIIYGLGKRYLSQRKIIEEILSQDTIVGYSDRDASRFSLVDNGICFVPEKILSKEFDYILVTQIAFQEVKEYLIGMGVPPKKIINIDSLKIIFRGKYEFHSVAETSCKEIMIINANIGFHGGSKVCFFAALALKRRGYSVEVGCGQGSQDAIDLFTNNGIGVVTFKSYPFIGGADVNILRKYDIVICNTFPTIPFVHLASKCVPTVWWIHEGPDNYGLNYYEDNKKQYPRLDDSEWMKRLNVIAVSSVAKNAFNLHYPNIISRCMPYGLPDEKTISRRKNEKIVFSVIGYVCQLKAQSIFIEAAKRLLRENTNSLEFLIVGDCPDNEYMEMLKKSVGGNSEIIFTGVKDSQGMLDIYSETDVVVCSSLIETMSLTVTEGMMNSKICITTDATGIAEYIEDGINGFICKAGDVESLTEKMQYVVDHFDELDDMRKNARKTYEKNFTLDILGDSLESEINVTIEKYRLDGDNEIISNCADIQCV